MISNCLLQKLLEVILKIISRLISKDSNFSSSIFSPAVCLLESATALSAAADELLERANNPMVDEAVVSSLQTTKSDAFLKILAFAGFRATSLNGEKNVYLVEDISWVRLKEDDTNSNMKRSKNTKHSTDL